MPPPSSSTMSAVVLAQEQSPLFGGVVSHGVKSTFAVTVSPLPGPAPDGPVGCPHQLSSALNTNVLKLSTPSVLPQIELQWASLFGPEAVPGGTASGPFTWIPTIEFWWILLFSIMFRSAAASIWTPFRFWWK